MSTKMGHDMVGNIQVMVLSTWLGEDRYFVEVKWDPAHITTPNRLELNVKKCPSHDKAQLIGLKMAGKEFGTPYDG